MSPDTPVPAAAGPEPGPDSAQLPGAHAQESGRILHTFAPAPDTEPRWAELLRRLWAEREMLAADFLRKFEVSIYDGAPVPREDVERTAIETMELLIFQLAGAEPPADLRSLPREVAARRARQGVPLEAFLGAVRSDFRVVWRGLERVASDDSMGVLVANMVHILDTVERYASSIQQAFSEEEALLARDEQLYRSRLTARLFAPRPPDAEETAQIAAALRVRPGDRFEVLAVVGDEVLRVQRQVAADRRSLFHDSGDALFLFRPWRQGRGWREDPPEAAAGLVDAVDGLAAVPLAAAQARILAEHRPPSVALATLEDTWMATAHNLLAENLPWLLAPVQEALGRCTPHERQRLLETASCYANTGSIKSTAEQLYCHRNTVVNRLHAFHQATGLDLTVPRQAAIALVALARTLDDPSPEAL